MTSGAHNDGGAEPVYIPAECYAGCIDPACPYIHFPSYICDDGATYAFRDDAREHNATLLAARAAQGDRS